MSYKQNAASNRDALFGNSGKSSKAKKSSEPKHSTQSATANAKTSKGYRYRSKEKKTPMKPGLVGEAKAAKLKEAKALQDKAKKCLQKGLFSKPGKPEFLGVLNNSQLDDSSLYCLYYRPSQCINLFQTSCRRLSKMWRVPS